MKPITALSLIFILVSCKQEQKGGEVLPAFDILLPDSVTRLNTAQIQEGQPIALLYFSPDCEHCQQETDSILHHMNSLKTIKFLFVTNDPLERLKIFKGYYRIDKYPNIILGIDEQFFIPRHFKGITTPYMVLYDRDKRQRKIFDGEAEVRKIIALVDSL